MLKICYLSRASSWVWWQNSGAKESRYPGRNNFLALLFHLFWVLPCTQKYKSQRRCVKMGPRIPAANKGKCGRSTWLAQSARSGISKRRLPPVGQISEHPSLVMQAVRKGWRGCKPGETVSIADKTGQAFQGAECHQWNKFWLARSSGTKESEWWGLFSSEGDYNTQIFPTQAHVLSGGTKQISEVLCKILPLAGVKSDDFIKLIDWTGFFLLFSLFHLLHLCYTSCWNRNIITRRIVSSIFQVEAIWFTSLLHTAEEETENYFSVQTVQGCHSPIASSERSRIERYYQNIVCHCF